MLSYNDFWYERGDKLTRDRRSSLIIDPPDGRIPFTAESRARAAERAARNNAESSTIPKRSASSTAASSASTPARR